MLKTKPIKASAIALSCSAVLLSAALTNPTLAASVTEATCPGEDQVCRQTTTGLALRALPRALSNIYKEPDASSEILASNVKAFWPVYVFERKDVDFSDGANPKGWYRIGPMDKDPLGWMQAKDILEWKQALVVSYKHPGSGADRRQPVLMFKSKEALAELVSAPDRAEKVKALHTGLEQTPPKVDDSLISREPKRFVSIDEKFYMLPVIDFETVDLFEDEARYLELAAAVPVQEGQASARSEEGKADTLLNESFLQESALSETVKGTKASELVFNIKFVIDMTSSMGPYIEGTKEAIKKVAQTVAQTNPEAKVRYGLVGYRDDLKIAPGLEFTAKNFTPELVDAAQFADAVAAAKEAEVSSEDYAEEVIAGVKEGINSAWDDNSIKIMVLVGDASSHPIGHPQNTTGLDVQQARDLATANKVSIVAMHLKEERAAPDHALAESQFQTLATNKGSEKPSYLPVAAENHEDFEKGVKALAAELSAIVASVRQGDTQIVSQPTEITVEAIDLPAITGASSDIEEQAKTIARDIAANALVDYLGAAANPPKDITAWVLDRDLTNPDDPLNVPLDVRVLLKRKDLNDIIIALEDILKAVKRSQLTGMQFFDSLQAVVTSSTKGSGSIDLTSAKRLADSGLLPSWVASLPYRSAIMEMSSEGYEALSAEERSKLEYEIEAKLKFYQQINEDNGKWQPLDERDASIDHVYPLPLATMP